MIGIRNVTENRTNGTYGEGVQLYVVQINQKELFTFRHVFEDGLSGCLTRAAKAALEYEDMMESKREEEKQEEILGYINETEAVMDEVIANTTTDLTRKIEEALSILRLYNETERHFAPIREEIAMCNKKCSGTKPKK